ncbi:hypothetical protein GCK72_002804 [Caenorhabditis remanei]|uniref:F-box domain-containing protein n=1 Tax=Caenorhabditis remanei TaxID=31234 RepID=A0A6A5HS10_CAERE|nr:hypothetical protein GCK72_002804 [Caenorhabditis remanei]KAF1770980.1 hypothetical protein GCK72_002804 [Caenorhabditis remanei]
MVFGDSITMRAYAISHLEQFHFHQIIENLPGFFEFEWFHLNEETDFNNLPWDEFKWRCCLCPRIHALTFITQITMRMHALRHIEQHHKFLFTEEFLTFEWLSLQQEMRASFDIRHYIPLQYTIQREDTFNGRDPNDYMLPQQYYFLPKEYATNTVICGFSYRSFSRIDFFLHIVIHGFIVDQSVSCVLRPITLDIKVRELMGQNNYSEAGLDDEPLMILSVDGKRLKAKMDLMNERKSNMSRLSDITTPFKSEIDTDGEMSTSRSRKSAMDARRLLTETFKVLQANARNRRDTWNATSSSSSSDDDDNSEDERFEKKLEMESTTKLERYDRSKSREPSAQLEKKKVDISCMRPAEIREWIRREARRRGVDWTEDSDESTSSDDDDSGEKTSTMGKKWANMKLQDIKEKIRQAAKRRNVTLSSGSSSSDSDMTENSIELSDLPPEILQLLVEKCDLVTRHRLRASSSLMYQLVNSTTQYFDLVAMGFLDGDIILKLVVEPIEERYTRGFQNNNTGGTLVKSTFRKPLEIENSDPSEKAVDWFRQMCLQKNVTIGKFMIHASDKTKKLTEKLYEVLGKSEIPLKIKSIHCLGDEAVDAMSKIMWFCDKRVLKEMRVGTYSVWDIFELFGKQDETVKNLEKIEIDSLCNASDEDVLSLQASVIYLRSENFTEDLVYKLIEKFTNRREDGCAFCIDNLQKRNLELKMIPPGFKEAGSTDRFKDYRNQLIDTNHPTVYLSVSEDRVALQIGYTKKVHFWSENRVIVLNESDSDTSDDSDSSSGSNSDSDANEDDFDSDDSYEDTFDQDDQDDD